SPGSRVARVSGGRCPAARSRRCCRAVARSPTPRPARRWRPSGARRGGARGPGRPGAAPGRSRAPRRAGGPAGGAAPRGGAGGWPGADGAAARTALAGVRFCVSVEVRRSAVAEVADVVLPVAPGGEKAGSFVDGGGRLRPFQRALDSPAVPDLRVLHLLAGEM